MVVAVAAVRMVQATRDQVIDVIAVRHRLATATGTVLMAFVVTTAGVLRRTGFRIRGIHVEGVFIRMVAMREVQMSVVQVADMVTMNDGGVPTAGAMRVVVVFVDSMNAHEVSPCCYQPGAAARICASLACARALETRSTTCWSASA